ncbi:23S rRNA (guanosine(2251)-2'-O)-methyltransferase RlmB [Peptoniphilus equinus]|uniref:23S rRNA (Guanosine(2251)-2'-O)-methyltransferase RlmB n=1 Tax=Peptoniphilus equinus TaxID=3016343 RepID=A0ABY7QRX1_9FIRM|nr:23S rRNA (guanosine(2251)-2'-O)-methyltransferase RlmB [Peptoniphilus equinus]WBW49532.1 23S rRNA (guanosine(2251)-2'-O)-methyltransferase RlmB [Peptoniphilus equinus]
MSYVYGRNPVIEVLKTGKVDKLYVQKGNREGSVKKIFGMAREGGILVTEVPKKKLDDYSEGNNHQGVVALVSDYNYATLEEITELEHILILDKIEDPHNFGAIARSAEAFGFKGILIPKHNAAYVNDVVYKTSAGAVENVRVAIVTNLSQAVDTLKDKGFWIYAADMEGEAYTTVNLKGKVALVIGNEGKGISPALKKHTDVTVSIPMVGRINSLNASCAASVLMAEVLRQYATAEVPSK